MPMAKRMMDVYDVLDRFPQETEAARVDGGAVAIEYGSALYEALYEHFASTGEMPYGVAKGRTDDPESWINREMAKYI